MKKKLKDRIYKEINKILFEDWDPIGVNQNRLLLDEYEGYVPSIFKLLNENADEIKLSKHLYNIASVNIGINLSMEYHLNIAHKLKKLNLT